MLMNKLSVVIHDIKTTWSEKDQIFVIASNVKIIKKNLLRGCCWEFSG